MAEHLINGFASPLTHDFWAGFFRISFGLKCDNTYGSPAAGKKGVENIWLQWPILERVLCIRRCRGFHSELCSDPSSMLVTRGVGAGFGVNGARWCVKMIAEASCAPMPSFIGFVHNSCVFGWDGNWVSRSWNNYDYD